MPKSKKGTPIIVFFSEEVTQTAIYEFWFEDGVPADRNERNEAIKEKLALGEGELKKEITDEVISSTISDVKIGLSYEDYVKSLLKRGVLS